MIKRILLVDDDLEFLNIMARRVESWGYKIISATSGKDALEAVENKRCDAVVLDYLMPDMDGVSTLEKIRKIDSDIPVIMFTAHPDMRAMRGAEKFKVSAFIPKLSVYVDAQAALKSALSIVRKESEKAEGA